jgi:hypothetical protein
MMKTLMAAVTALSFLGATGLQAQTAPTMPVEIVTQDAAGAGPNENHLLVPILFLILLLATAGGSTTGGGVVVPN